MPILENAAVQFYVGDVYTGVTPTFTGPGLAIVAQVKRIEYGDEIKKTNTSGASGVVANEYHSREGEAKMQGVQPATGSALRSGTGGSLVGYNCKVVVKPASTLTLADTLIGVCTKWNPSGGAGDNQVIDVEIDLSSSYRAAS